jgi:hypothetical protein
MVANVCNPSYLGGCSQEKCLMPAWAKNYRDYLNKQARYGGAFCNPSYRGELSCEQKVGDRI